MEDEEGGGIRLGEGALGVILLLMRYNYQGTFRCYKSQARHGGISGYL
jgi:hypothetical protein